jgi:hypothetical protein
MVQRNTTVLWRELDGEAVLLNPTAGCSYNLNRVGTFVWKLLDGKHSLEDITEAVCTSYEVAQEQAQQDIELLLADLRQNNLVVDNATTSNSSQGHV